MSPHFGPLFALSLPPPHDDLKNQNFEKQLYNVYTINDNQIM